MTTDTETATRTRLARQAVDYAALSRRYAADGDARLAVLAAWAGDLRAVQTLLWESGLPAGEHPDEQLDAVSDAIGGALASRDLAAAGSVRAVVEEARRALLDTFDASVHDQLAARLLDLDHLDDVRPPAPGSADQAVSDRLDGRTGEELVADLLTTAGDCRAVARAMTAAGHEDAALTQRTWADLASFEAFLVLSSGTTGDATLAMTQLRWDAAARLAGDRPVRSALLASVLPSEEPALLGLLEPVGDDW